MNYPHHVEYVYNSRGFRDDEWPLSLCDLQQAIWCVGDSFTVGIGQPLSHTWPQVLQYSTKIRTINVSMDGASNQWILRRAQDILREINPKRMIVMWSYTHRRENPDTRLNDEDRRYHSSSCHEQQDLAFWLAQQKELAGTVCNIIQLAIPDFSGLAEPAMQALVQRWGDIKDQDWQSCPTSLTDLLDLPSEYKAKLKDLQHWQWFQDILTEMQRSDDDLSVCVHSDGSKSLLPTGVVYIHERLDRARDGHHFDILTARWVVQQIVLRLAG